MIDLPLHPRGRGYRGRAPSSLTLLHGRLFTTESTVALFLRCSHPSPLTGSTANALHHRVPDIATSGADSGGDVREKRLYISSCRPDPRVRH